LLGCQVWHNRSGLGQKSEWVESKVVKKLGHYLVDEEGCTLIGQ